MNRLIQYRNIWRWLTPLLLICCMLFCVTTPVNAQKKARTRLKAYYEKLPNNDRKVSIILTQGSGKKIRGVQNAEIRVSTLALDSAIELASLRTDSLGKVNLFIEANYPFPENEEGYSVINVKYSGNDSLKAAKKKIEFLDLNMELSFNIVDSIRYVEVLAFKIDSLGNRKTIDEIGIDIGVERLFSVLYLEEVDTNEDGIASMEFPIDIPGDSIGMITVTVRLEEHDDYGTITKSGDINWGISVDYSTISNGRSLFGDEAPLWMIISVAVVLLGAWYHFLLAVLKVYRIKSLEQNST